MPYVPPEVGKGAMSVRAGWLFGHGGPVIRYRLAREVPHLIGPQGLEALAQQLLAAPGVRAWLERLQSYEGMVERQRQGAGLGASGNSSFLHGSTDENLEVVLPKLAQLGVHAGMAALDDRAGSWLQVLEAALAKDITGPYMDDGQFLYAVYTAYDHQLIVASSLAMAGYANHPAVERVITSRLDEIYDVVRTGSFAIYETPGSVSVTPREWGDRVLRHDLCGDGRIRLPFVHDICAFASRYPYLDSQARDKVDVIVAWMLAPEHQRFLYNYGYVRCPSGRGKSVGHKMGFPGYFGFEGPDFDPRALVLRCWQMAPFPAAMRHRWLRESLDHLESFVTERGTYLLPPSYLTESAGRGYWIHGARMGLGENRRSPGWREVESTFWMLAIQTRSGVRAS